MNRIKIVLLALCSIVILGATHLANAQAPGEQPTDKTVPITDDLRLSFGLKLWFNKWENAKFGLNNPDPHIVHMNDSSIGYIPTLGLRYKDFFISASGMFATAYKFDVPLAFTEQSTPTPGIPPGQPGFVPGDTSFGASRQEADVNFGYYIHPMLGASIGYKGTFQTLHIQNNVVGGHPRGRPEPTPSQIKYRYNGPTVGLSTNVPFGEGGLGLLPFSLNLYGNAGGGYLFTSTSFKPVEFGNHAAYGVVEGGLAYKPDQIPLVFTVGYKYQLINTQLNSNLKQLFRTNSVNDITSGPLIGVIFVH